MYIHKFYWNNFNMNKKRKNWTSIKCKTFAEERSESKWMRKTGLWRISVVWRRGERGYWGRGMMGGWKMGHAVEHANRNAALWQPDSSRRSVKTWNWNRMTMSRRSLGTSERFSLVKMFSDSHKRVRALHRETVCKLLKRSSLWNNGAVTQ